ncbi:hypothetical protein [uncultured Alistipes sp.]|uniref:hypothetical protein n=1 Tax=uncultured Alistipes sp. TaxID=538949 RepID=UPI00261405DB|nr:hypothetical protein [uncultured Alistipes sp.]
MKKLIISLFGFFVISPLTAQERWKYNDFTDGKKVAVDGITYIIENPLQHITGQLDEQMISIRRENEPSEQFDKFGEYPDGTFCNDPEECAGIIRHRQEIPLIIHAAWKKAFPKEERESHPEVLIFAFPILDLQGKIEALAFTVPVFREYAVQPEQIATLDRELRANLQFELNTEKAKKFVRIPGQFRISFRGLAKIPTANLKPNAESMLYPEQSIGGKNPKP